DCGATVVAADLNEAGLLSIASDRIHPVVADLTKAADCRAVADRAAGLGPITGLLNSAGIELHGSVIDMSEADWDKVFAVNVKAIFLLSKHVVPHMIANGGGAVGGTAAVRCP